MDPIYCEFGKLGGPLKYRVRRKIVPYFTTIGTLADGMKSANALAREVDKMSNWEEVEVSLKRLFVFEDFRGAMAFMTEVAKIAEEMNHHPEWRNVYNKVWVSLTTHDAGHVTELDYRLAEAMDSIAAEVA